MAVRRLNLNGGSKITVYCPEVGEHRTNQIFRLISKPWTGKFILIVFTNYYVYPRCKNHVRAETPNSFPKEFSEDY
jgi:hypothetical protein